MASVANSCAVCGKEFLSSRRARFCSKACANKAWYLSNREHRLAKNKTYRENHQNRERVRRLNARWFSLNRAYLSEYRRRRRAKAAEDKRRKYSSDLSFKLAHVLRSRLNHALRAKKSESVLDVLGCSIEELKTYLESKFYPHPETGEMMTWDNYGRRGWHIDHIRPLSSFNLFDPKQMREACHYTNLQPMWASENLSKGATYDKKLRERKEEKSHNRRRRAKI